MYADSHIHTRHSHDSVAEIYEYIEQAKLMKISHLCFTDHVDPIYAEYFPEEFFKNLRHNQSISDITLKAGIEFSEPHLNQELFHQLSNNYQYDMIIGSLHLVNGVFPSPKIRDRIPMREFYDAYWKEIDKMIDFGRFDVVGHIDYPRRAYDMVLYNEKQLSDIFKKLLDKNMIIEINTSSMRRGATEPMPTKEILELYKHVGGQYVTVGSDAHRPEHLGEFKDAAKSVIKDIGLQEVIFEQRKIVKINWLLRNRRFKHYTSSRSAVNT